MKTFVWVMLVLSTAAIDHREKHFLKKQLLLRRLGLSSLDNSVIGQQSPYQSAPSPLVTSALGSLAGAGPVNILGHDFHTTITRHLGVPIAQPYGVPVEQNIGIPFKVHVAVPVDRPFAVPVPDLVPVPVDHPFPHPVQPAVPLVRQVSVAVSRPSPFGLAVPAAVARPIVRPHPPGVRLVARAPHGWAGTLDHAGIGPHILINSI